jgi:endonuclease YncB( thermonuclease family)
LDINNVQAERGCLPETLLKVIPFLLLSLLPQFAFSSEIQGRAMGVCDGDTITVLNNGHTDRVRLHGVNPLKKVKILVRGPSGNSTSCHSLIMTTDN